MSYTHLTQEERYHIYALRKADFSQKYISNDLQCSQATVSRELNRNKGLRNYRPKQVQLMSAQRRCNNAYHIDDDLWKEVIARLNIQHSPEQISAKLPISHQSIYRYIDEDKRSGGSLHQQLRCKKKRKKRYASSASKGKMQNKVSIHLRPKVIENRKRLGDWEIDTVIGANHKGALVTMVERKSRSGMLLKSKRI